ncbi:MAG: MmgE/PrpD family protein [Rhodospirillaceae bacterium]
MTKTNSECTPTEAFGAWVATAPNNWPYDALHSAKREFIDLVGVAVPGAMDESTMKTIETVMDWGAGPCTVVGQAFTMAAPWAALINGTAGHALDFDDNFDPPKAHATTVLAPSILALGEQENCTGRACLDAYIVGLQIMGRVGQGVNPLHRNRGWHATATVGAIGAAAACARLLKLDSLRASYAISLATSMAAGFMSQFGTMAKPVHAGLAAKSGILAASMAKGGVTASLNTLEGSDGMNHLMVGPDYEQQRDSLTHFDHGQNLRYKTENVGEPLLILEHAFRVKRFPNCGSAHRAMDILLLLKEDQDFRENEVDRIVVYAPKVHLNNLMHHNPKDPMEAKFSLQYGLACILHTGNCTLSDFTPDAVRRPSIRSLFDRVELMPIDKLEGEVSTSVEVHLTSGTVLEKSLDMPLGSKLAPFSDTQYWDKFNACVNGLLTRAQCESLRDALDRLNELENIHDLMTHLRTPFAEIAQ